MTEAQPLVPQAQGTRAGVQAAEPGEGPGEGHAHEGRERRNEGDGGRDLGRPVRLRAASS